MKKNFENTIGKFICKFVGHRLYKFSNFAAEGEICRRCEYEKISWKPAATLNLPAEAVLKMLDLLNNPSVPTDKLKAFVGEAKNSAGEMTAQTKEKVGKLFSKLRNIAPQLENLKETYLKSDNDKEEKED